LIILDTGLRRYDIIAGAIISGLAIAVILFVAQLHVARKYVPIGFPNGSYIFVLLVLMATAASTLWFVDWCGKFLRLLR